MAINHDTKGAAMPDFIDPFEGQDGRIITPTDLANALHIGAKSVRDRMRKLTDKADQPGSGNHWEIEVGTDAYLFLVETLQSPRNGNKAKVRFALKSDD